MKYRHMFTSADIAMSEEPEELTPYAIPAAATSAPWKSSCAAVCLVIISCKGYEPKLQLLSYSLQWVSMCKLLQVKPLQPSIE